MQNLVRFWQSSPLNKTPMPFFHRTLQLLTCAVAEDNAAYFVALSASSFALIPSIFFCKIKSLRWVSQSAILDTHVTVVTFFHWPTYTAVTIQRIKFGRNLTYIYESAVTFLRHLIELNSTRQKCNVWTGPKRAALMMECYEIKIDFQSILHSLSTLMFV